MHEGLTRLGSVHRMTILFRGTILLDFDGSLDNEESAKGLKKNKTLWDTLCRHGHTLLDTELHPIQVGAHPRTVVVPGQ